jgi:hypothetical protein
MPKNSMYSNTDKKDALTIGQFLLAYRGQLLQVSYPQNSQDLKDLARERESLAVMIAGLKNDVRRLLQMTFSELARGQGFPLIEHGELDLVQEAVR